MRNKALVAYLCIVLIGITACSRPTVQRKTSDTGIMNLFEFSSTCEPPCWLKLVPGKTTRSETLSILETMSDIDQETIEEQVISFENYSIDLQRISWRFKHSSERVTALADFLDNELAWIRFNTFGFISIEDTLKLYGEPEKVFAVSASSDTKGVEIFFLYPSKGVILSYGFWEHFEKTVRIDPKSMISCVTYYDFSRWTELVSLGVPTSLGSDYYAWLAGMQLLDEQPAWEGFDYEYPVNK